jgi:ribosomal protein L10
VERGLLVAADEVLGEMLAAALPVDTGVPEVLALSAAEAEGLSELPVETEGGAEAAGEAVVLALALEAPEGL